MELKELLPFDTIVVQCHDTPDADAVASGWAVYQYLQSHGKNVRLVYGGAHCIQKSNLRLMVERLHIPIEYKTSLETEPDLLVTVDCQYGERNVQRFPARTVAIIDHHRAGGGPHPALWEVRENYGACATVVWDMLVCEHFPVTDYEPLATALYYGLFMDTVRMQELRHPKDKDLRDQLEFCTNKSDLTLFQNCNLSLEEMKIAGHALCGCAYSLEYHFAVVDAEPCDPNILGIISDMLNEVDTVDTCVAFCMLPGGAKLSVRSCVSHTMADELVQHLAKDIGSGGGHPNKSGGFLPGALLAGALERQFGVLEKDADPEEYRKTFSDRVKKLLFSRMEDYYQNQDMFTAGSDETPDLTGEKVYRKNRLPIGYVPLATLYPVGTKVVARMLEGDLPFTVQEGTYLIIGIEGEVYKNDRDYLVAHNDLSEEPYVFHGEYAPMLYSAVKAVSGLHQGEPPKSLVDCAKTAVPKDGSCIFARQVTRRTKVFVSWSDRYMLGNPGDWLVARQENPKDIYIVKDEIFQKSYAPVS